MNLSYRSGNKRRVHNNGKVSASPSFKKSRIGNLLGIRKILADKQEPAFLSAPHEQIVLLPHTSTNINNITNTTTTTTTTTTTPVSFTASSSNVSSEPTVQPMELDSLAIHPVASVAVPTASAINRVSVDFSLLPHTTSTWPPAHATVPIASSAGNIPAAPPTTPTPVNNGSKQKPFSESGPASKRSTISSIWSNLKDSARGLLTQMGRTAESDADIGHILQHAGGRVLNVATHTRGNVEAVEVLEALQAKEVKDGQMKDIEATLKATDAQRKGSGRRLETFNLARSQVVQNLVMSYVNAAEGAPGKEVRARVLSALAESFSRKELNEWVFRLFGRTNVSISRSKFKTARLHALGCGAGNIPSTIKTVRRRIGTEALLVPDGGDECDSPYVFCTNFVQSFLTNLAFGTRQTVLSSGEVLELNKIERTRSVEEIKALYHEACDQGYDAEGNGVRVPISRVPSKHLDVIISTLSGGAENSNLAALDSVYCKFGLQNFDLFRRFIDIVTVDRPDVQRNLISQCDKVELFLRKEYGDHVFETSRADTHSKKRAFADSADEASEVESEEEEGGSRDAESLFCLACQCLPHFLLDLESALSTAHLHPLEDSREELALYLSETLVHGLDIYLGHLVRKYHETELEQKLFSQLDPVTQCVINIDYKMRVLSLVWREPMSHFFGKRGISFLGFAITRRKTAAEANAECEYNIAHPRVQCFQSEFVTEFYDAISDDSTEDGWSLGRAVMRVLSHYKAKNPLIIEAIVLSDGAGNFAGTEFWIFLSLIRLFTGIGVLLHIVKEAGCGKTFLDTHFAFCVHIITKLVAEGRGSMNVYGAADVVRNLTTDAGIANSTAVLLQYANRPTSGPSKCTKKDTADAVTDTVAVDDEEHAERGVVAEDSADVVSGGYRTFKGLGKFSQREYNYNADGTFVSCSLTRIALYCETPDMIVSADTMRSCCPNHTFPTINEVTSSIVATFYDSAARRDANTVATVPATLCGPQLVLSEHDRSEKKVIRQRQLSAKAVRQEDVLQRKQEDQGQQRENSRLHYCSHPQCNFYSSTASGLQKHMSNNNPDSHQVSTARMALSFMSALRPHTDTDALKVYCQSKTSTVKHAASKSSHLSTSRRESLVTYEEYEQQYPEYAPKLDSSTYVLQLFQEGFGHQKKAKTVYNTARSLDFIVFLTGRGDPKADNGNKTLPAQAEKAMFLLGTVAGEDILKETAHDRAVMRANTSNNRTFRLSELLSQDQLKAQMSRPLSQLRASAERARRIEAEAALRLADPLHGIISTSPKATLQTRWKQLHRRHQNNRYLQFEAAVMLMESTATMAVGELRIHIMTFMNLSERQQEDMHFFGL